MKRDRLGLVLKDARLSKDVKVYEVTSTLRINANNIEKIENGSARISLETFLKLCKFYGLDPREVIDEITRTN